jgi:dTDP-glucose pyrophosphorylase
MWPASVFSEPELERVCVGPEASIRDAISCIDQSDRGIALVVDQLRRLLDTITDGDVRRAMLAHVDLATPVGSLGSRRLTSPYPRPVTMPVTATPADVLRVMEEQRVRQVPLLDSDGRVVGLVATRDLLPSDDLSLAAVVMAGGHGTRLRPLTNDLPKPMLPVAGRPLMEHIVSQLERAGIRRVSIATHYQAEKIVEHFGDGHAFGVDLSYVNEDRPLGTAGALALMNRPEETLLVMNGDIMTQVDFHAMHVYHREHRADLTIAVRAYQVQVPYGVIECEGARVSSIKEKPHLDFFVNAGIYLLEPSALSHIPSGRHFDMPDLISALLACGKPVVCFPIREYWLDIGEHDSYMQAQRDMVSGLARMPVGTA